MRLFPILITAIFILAINVSALEAASPRILLNSKPISFTVEPFIKEDRVVVPMRSIFEALGADVEWYPLSQSVSARKGNELVLLSIGSKTAFKYSGANSGAVAVELDIAPLIQQDRTMVPLRFVGEALNTGVKWDGSSRTVYITQ